MRMKVVRVQWVDGCATMWRTGNILCMTFMWPSLDSVATEVETHRLDSVDSAKSLVTLAHETWKTEHATVKTLPGI